MCIDIGNIRFLDSLCFFNQSLRSLPAAFGIEDKVQKGYCFVEANRKQDWMTRFNINKVKKEWYG